VYVSLFLYAIQPTNTANQNMKLIIDSHLMQKYRVCYVLLPCLPWDISWYRNNFTFLMVSAYSLLILIL